jgi:hypothetical protein
MVQAMLLSVQVQEHAQACRDSKLILTSRKNSRKTAGETAENPEK